MSDNWIVEVIQWAFDFWNNIIVEVWGLLSQSPSSFMGGGAWSIIQNINVAFQSLGYGLLMLFFLMSFLKTASSLRELRRPETVVRLIIQLAVAKTIVTHGMDIVLWLFSFGGSLVSRVAAAAGGGISSIAVPAEIVEAIENSGFWASIGLMIVALIGALGVIVVSITVLLMVYGRFFKIYMYAALAPIALAGFGGSETSFMGKSFLKNFAAVCLEGAVIMIACAIWSAVATHTISGLWDVSMSPTAMCFAYLAEVIFSLILLAGIIKMSDKIPRAAMGL
jgi:hypothetical protein